jgi:hypothetical protein
MTTLDQRAALAQELEWLMRVYAAATTHKSAANHAFVLADLALQHATEILAALRSTAAAQTSDARYRFLRGDAPDHSTRWPRWEVRYWNGEGWRDMRGIALDDLLDDAIAEDAAIAASGEAG